MKMGEDRLTEFGKIKVSEIMVHDPIYTHPDEKISTTELLMLRKNIGGLPVVHDGKSKQVIGIITQRDIRLARFAMALDSPYTIVQDLMTPEPFTVNENDTIKDVLEVMFFNQIERVPVVNESKELIGLVLEKDILKKLLELLS
ncbi:MAG: CBS domain-containing protein [Candidatus Lokiarchaeota archaeon]|nr:CBS domain-containing protein [Candidatus Lokiarchaeota archaeon]